MTFSRSDISGLHYAVWASKMPKPGATDWQQTVTSYEDPDLSKRANYFIAVARHGFPSGLLNVHFPDALTLEPYNAHASLEASFAHNGGSLCGISCDDARGAELDIVDAELVSNYLRPMETALDALQSTCGRREFLFDPYYGFVFWEDEGKVRTRCITMAYWVKRTSAFLPPDEVRSPRGMLRQGLDAGKLFFGTPLGLTSRYDAGWIPQIDVSTKDQYSQVIDWLRLLMKPYPEFELWFRGQTKEYLVPARTAVMASGVEIYSHPPRPNLAPALYRELSQYTADLAAYRNLVLQFGRWSYWADAHRPLDEIHEAQNRLKPKGFAPDWQSTRTYFDEAGNVSRSDVREYEVERQELKQGLILQHYGVPSPYLDITSDPATALWFATNRYTKGKSYTEHKWEDRPAEEWPVVYVMPLFKDLDPYVNSAQLVQGTNALRPQRQACGLLAAGGNLFRNFAATCVALSIRLAPGVTADKSLSAEYLFPSPKEDGYLKVLLDNEGYIRANGGTITFPVSSISP